MQNLGAIIQRDYRNVTHKDRDAFVGAAVPRPSTYLPDISWLTRNSQKDTPTCGAHAASHLKAILDKADTGINRYSPMSLWRYLKTFDNFVPSVGTSMEAIMKGLKEFGICSWETLPTDFTLSETAQAYTFPTEAMKDEAQPKIIKSYAITYAPSQDQIRDIIWKDKVAILLLRFDESWWKSALLLFNGQLKYGHFVCVYGYDDNSVYIVDSSDDIYSFKRLGKDFKVVAIGSAIDMPDAEVKRLVNNRAILQKIVALYRQMKTLLK